MKLKYYLRGAGIGIIVSTLIFVVALAFYQPTMSEEEIKRAAAKLGMVMEEEQNSSKQENSDEKDTKTVAESTDQNQTTADETQTETITFDIFSDTNSAQVVSNLYNAGFIDNEATFNDFLEDNGYDSLLQPGSCQLHKGMTYDEIAKILTTKQEFR